VDQIDGIGGIAEFQEWTVLKGADLRVQTTCDHEERSAHDYKP
jgi:hypothetical protein